MHRLTAKINAMHKFALRIGLLLSNSVLYSSIKLTVAGSVPIEVQNLRLFRRPFTVTGKLRTAGD